VKVLACVSGVGRGHAARCRPILEELRVRGHDCVAAVPGRRAGSLLAPVCAVLLPPEGFHDRVAPPVDAGLAYTCVYDFEMSFSFYQRDVLDSTRAVVAFVDGALETVRPDVVLVDQVPPATGLAHGRGLPVVQITHGPLVPGHGPWAYWLPERPPELRYPPPLPAVNAALEEAGAPAIERLDELLAGELTVIPTPPGLGTVHGALHVDVPALLDDTQVELSRRAGRPLVALLLGTTPHLLEEAVRGTLAAGADAVVVEADGAHLDADPAVRAVGRVDAAAVLRQVDAAIHHGGSGTIVTCLQAGVPSVAIPTQGEQAFNAHRTAELGLGAIVPASDEPLEQVAIREDFVTLAHRRPHRLAERLAAALRELGPPLAPALPQAGAGAIADAIERLG
jgi:UDP:flavonoid glycosyltransferase YjiC (YdhE family)